MIKVVICEHNHDGKEGETMSIKSSCTCHKSEDLEKYIEANGYHFSSELAEYASSLMRNADKSSHTWSSEEVKSAYQLYGYTKAADCTWGDVAYIANMAYADFFGMLFKTEQECLQYSLADISDVDGYEGKQFCRWLADMRHTDTEIDWEKFI